MVGKYLIGWSLAQLKNLLDRLVGPLVLDSPKFCQMKEKEGKHKLWAEQCATGHWLQELAQNQNLRLYYTYTSTTTTVLFLSTLAQLD